MTAEGEWYPWRLEGIGFPLAGGRRLYGVGSPLLCPQECVRLSQAYREPERKAIQIVVCPQLEHTLHSQTRINRGLPLRSPASPAESARPSSSLLSSFISLHSVPCIFGSLWCLHLSPCLYYHLCLDLHSATSASHLFPRLIEIYTSLATELKHMARNPCLGRRPCLRLY